MLIKCEDYEVLNSRPIITNSGGHHIALGFAVRDIVEILLEDFASTKKVLDENDVEILASPLDILTRLVNKVTITYHRQNCIYEHANLSAPSFACEQL